MNENDRILDVVGENGEAVVFFAAQQAADAADQLVLLEAIVGKDRVGVHHEELEEALLDAKERLKFLHKEADLDLVALILCTLCLNIVNVNILRSFGRRYVK